MNLVKISNRPEQYLNMDYIESVGVDGDMYYAYINNFSGRYLLSKEAYETILKYGKIGL